MKFATKLMALFSGLFLAGSVIVIYFVYSANIKILEKDVTVSLEENAFHTVDQIDRMLYERYLDIKELATDPIISSRNSTSRMISGRLTEYLTRHGIYASLSFFDMRRIRIADTADKEVGNQELLEDYWTDIAQGRNFVIDIHQSQSLNKPVFHLASVVRDKNGIPLGVVVARMNIEELYDLANRALGIHGKEGVFNIDLLDKNGLILYSIHNKTGILKDTSPDWSDIRKSLQEGKKTGISRYTNPKENIGEELLVFAREAGYRDFKGSDWTLTISLPSKVAFASAVALRNRLAFIFSAITVLILIGTWFFSHRITVPITKLNSALQKFGKGNRDVTVEINSGDEIGRLSESFNKMALDIKSYEEESRAYSRNLEIKVAERTRALKSSKEFIETAFNSLSESVAVIDPHSFRILDVNRIFIEWSGMKKEEIIGKTCHEITHRKTEPCTMHGEDCPLPKMLETRTSRTAEHVHDIKGDGKRYTEITASPILNERGEIFQVVYVAKDITERRNAEVAIRESEERYRDLFENANDLIQSVDMEGRLLYVNRKWLAVLGYSKEEVKNLTFMDVLRKDQIPHCAALLKRIYAGETINHAEAIFVSKDGREITVEGNASAHLIDGKFVSTRGIFRDITERKIAEEKIKLAYGELDQIFNTAADGMIVIDRDFDVLRVNKTFLSLMGLSMHEAVGRKCYEIFHSGPLCHTTRCPMTRITGGDERVEIEVEKLRKNGNKFPCVVTATPFITPDGELIGIVEDIRDVTEYNQMQGELLKARKLESVGILAGGIAHDFNNLLQVILTGVEFTKMLLPPEGKPFKILSEAETASQQARELSFRLITFAKGGTPHKQITSLSKMLKESVDFALKNSNVTCEFALPGDLHTVEIDEGQMNQVIKNLVINAKEAMPGGGVIEVKARNVAVTDRDNLPLRDGNYLRISVKDHGIGISEENLTRIFDPYFTTKEMGNRKGMGLGLAICHSIINNHGGIITVDSTPGSGTTFYLYLPVGSSSFPG